MTHSMKRRTFCGVAVTTLAGLGNAQAQVTGIGDAINKAGRQRMLSQRMAEFYLASSSNVDGAASLLELTKARDEFVPALEVLRNAPEANGEIRQELALADGQWLFLTMRSKPASKALKPPATSSSPARTCCRSWTGSPARMRRSLANPKDCS
ncbi:MAG: hypothetical protein JWP47_1356 [Polaromonas sp.]|nr:hypothetical protein [Polaromonas sp.]